MTYASQRPRRPLPVQHAGHGGGTYLLWAIVAVVVAEVLRVIL